MVGEQPGDKEDLAGKAVRRPGRRSAGPCALRRRYRSLGCLHHERRQAFQIRRARKAADSQEAVGNRDRRMPPVAGRRGIVSLDPEIIVCLGATAAHCADRQAAPHTKRPRPLLRASPGKECHRHGTPFCHIARAGPRTTPRRIRRFRQRPESGSTKTARAPPSRTDGRIVVSTPNPCTLSSATVSAIFFRLASPFASDFAK